MHGNSLLKRALAALICVLLYAASAFPEETQSLNNEPLSLNALIKEALENNKAARVSLAKSAGAHYRVPQQTSLPDPMFMFGYQNEGWDRYTYGEMPDAQWMFSVSQMVPFPGKRALKGSMAAKEAESLGTMSEAVRLDVVREVKERYYDLFFAHKAIELIEEKRVLFARIENAALAGYASQMTPLQEVTMAQTEKYMLTERQEMLRQRIVTAEAMLNRALGRVANLPLGRPAEPDAKETTQGLRYSLEDALKAALANSPEIRSKKKMLEAAGLNLEMARREYYPDFTFTGSVFKRSGEFEDMWSLTASINVPLFYRTKQKSAVLEAEEKLNEARLDLEEAELMTEAAVRENYSMAQTALRLMTLYKESLLPKARQSYEAGLAGYSAGKTDIMSLIKSLTSVVEYEILYWGQFVELKKAEARIEALMGEK